MQARHAGTCAYFNQPIHVVSCEYDFIFENARVPTHGVSLWAMNIVKLNACVCVCVWGCFCSLRVI